MTRKTTNSACAAVSIALMSLAAAPSAQAQMKESFEGADADHNGHVTLPEYEAYVEAMMSRRDGAMARRFKAMNPQEQMARLQQSFDKKDIGHKNYLSREDWDRS